MFCVCAYACVTATLFCRFFLHTIYNSVSLDKRKPSPSAVFPQWSLVSVVASFWEHSALRYCMKGTKLMQIVVVIPWQWHLSDFHLSFSLMLRENRLCYQGDSLHRLLKNLKYSIRHRDTIKMILPLSAWEILWEGKVLKWQNLFSISHLH